MLGLHPLVEVALGLLCIARGVGAMACFLFLWSGRQ